MHNTFVHLYTRQLLVSTLMAALVSACSHSPTAPTRGSSLSDTRLSISSDPSTLVGSARTYTLENAKFRALAMRSGGALEIDVTPIDSSDKSGPWTIIMGGPSGQELVPGTYNTTQFDTAVGYGFDVFGSSSDCNRGTGTVTIRDVAITADAVKRFSASFTMRCQGPAIVHGDIVVMADPWR